MPVIATAGHVDHGKSALVQALTGTDPDRLREEKERGLTIDLGFAELRLPSGREASIIDVPGHERFIKNMLAGVGGIDLALVVVDANEGVMPQTREHLAIIDLLSIEHGVIALTKADLVDEVTQIESQVCELVSETTLKGAPIIPCSSKTGAGLDALLGAIDEQVAVAPEARDLGRPRLSIDRAFTMAGFGTVVTGTLTRGWLHVGDEVELLPGGLLPRIRGLQNHGRRVEVAAPGRRTAVNLSGVAVEDLRRGMVLALPGTLAATTSIDMRLRAVPYLERPVRHNTTVSLHVGPAESEARLLLLDTDSLSPRDACWAQLRLAEATVVDRGDRFVIRDPNGTLGGGTVTGIDAPRHRRRDERVIAMLESLARGEASPTHRVEDVATPALTAAEEAQAQEFLATLRATPFAPPQHGRVPAPLFRALVARGDVVKAGEVVFAADAYERMVSLITDRLRANGPLTLGEARDLLGTSRRYAQAVLESMDARKITRREGEARVLRQR
jgi:selenocysteine-specific elongation factor